MGGVFEPILKYLFDAYIGKSIPPEFDLGQLNYLNFARIVFVRRVVCIYRAQLLADEQKFAMII
jgi:hypothetical protein